jgi:hypothetical protein
MRVILIEDKDSRALLDSLKLESLTASFRLNSEMSKQEVIDTLHRAFHYRVCVWLQEQGCDVVR